jgi:hypothetical protein
MSDPKQTALDYLNNWRDAQVRNTELEQQLAEAKAAIAVAKTAKGWDEVPIKLHQALDKVFAALQEQGK